MWDHLQQENFLWSIQDRSEATSSGIWSVCSSTETCVFLFKATCVFSQKMRVWLQREHVSIFTVHRAWTSGFSDELQRSRWETSKQCQSLLMRLNHSPSLRRRLCWPRYCRSTCEQILTTPNMQRIKTGLRTQTRQTYQSNGVLPQTEELAAWWSGHVRGSRHLRRVWESKRLSVMIKDGSTTQPEGSMCGVYCQEHEGLKTKTYLLLTTLSNRPKKKTAKNVFQCWTY